MIKVTVCFAWLLLETWRKVKINLIGHSVNEKGLFISEEMASVMQAGVILML